MATPTITAPPAGFISGSASPDHTHTRSITYGAGPAPSYSGQPWYPSGGGEGQNASSKLYLFTFLAAIILLLGVGATLVLRALHVRRQFQRQIVEAIARGDALPQYRSAFYGAGPPKKKEDQLPPMPFLWQSKMVLTDEKAVKGRDEEDLWSWLTPVSLNTVERPGQPVNGADPTFPHLPTLREEMVDAVRDMFPRLSRQRRREAARVRAPQDDTIPLMQLPTVADVPEEGSDLRVGVMIAMPCEGVRMEMWQPLDPEETEMPEVCFGVMECTVRSKEE